MSFKPGDKVKIRDGSWAIKSVDGCRKKQGWVDLADHEHEYVVVSDDPNNQLESCNSGVDEYLDKKYAHNTTVIQRGTAVILIHRDFLKPALCPTCGRTY